MNEFSPTPNAADPPVAVGKRGGLSQVSSGQLLAQVKPGRSADLIVGWRKGAKQKTHYW